MSNHSQSRHPRRRRIAVAAAGVAIAGLALVPAPAQGGTYAVRQCSSSVAAQAAWASDVDSYRGRNRCSSGEGLQIYHQGRKTPQGREASWSWSAPRGTIFKSVRASASLASAGGHRAQLRVRPLAGPAFSFGGGRGFRVHRRRGELSRFEARLRCGAAGGCGAVAEDRAHAYLRGVRLRLADRSAPRVTDAAGPLLKGRVARGERAVTIDARDRGGGVSRVWAEAAGVQVASRAVACELDGGFATRLVPCPRTVSETRTVDTTAAPFETGPNALAFCAEDLALKGRRNSACRRASAWIDNVCPESSGEGARLSARFSGGRARAVVRSDQPATLGGRLADGGGNPVAGGTVCALARTRLSGSPVVITATARTDADGRYTLELPPGPNRSVFIHNARAEKVVARHGLEAYSRARPSLRVLPSGRVRRGGRLRFSGQLPGPSCAGRLVAIEARVGPRHWQTFKLTRSDGACSFAASYRLRATTRATRYLFRAHVRRQPGYPYLPGRSVVRSKRVG